MVSLTVDTAGQNELALNAEFTDSTEQRMQGSVDNRDRSRNPLPTNSATSTSKGGTGRQREAGRDSYCHPGYRGAYGLWNDRLFAMGSGSAMAPRPSSGLMKFYGPSEVSPPFRYSKQGQFQNIRPPMVQNSKGRILNENSTSNSTRKGEYETWNENCASNSREKSTRKGEYETSDEITCGPRVNKRNASGDKCNAAEFQTEYGRAKFYVIKSYSEDDVHKCIKYDVWSSTCHGNKKLDAAFHDAEVKVGEFGKCPVFLFFSVNGSGQFVGLAEMIGKVDYNKTMDFWQLDKWRGFFPVKWHIIKDIPNVHLRHILLENNENKPVTFTRDTQEIGLKQGLEMLKIFKNYSAKTSVLDDHEFYEDREKAILGRKNSKPATHQTDDYKEDLWNDSVIN